MILDDTATLLIAAAAVLVGLVAGVTPYLTRPDLFFGVTVQPWLRATPEGRRVLRHYLLWVAVNTAIAIALAGALRGLGFAAAALLAFAWQGLGATSAYFAARRRVLPHGTAPSTVRQAELAPRRGALPGGWPLHAGPFALIAAAALYLHGHWASLPERFPVHWGIDGQPNRWASRTAASVYGPLLSAVLMAAGLILLAALTQKSVRPIQVAGAPARAERRFRRTVAWLLVAVEYQVTLAFIWVSFLPLAGADGNPLRTSPPPLFGAVLIASVVFVLLLAAILASMGQGGSRLVHAPHPAPGAAAAAPVGDRSPDDCWKGGVIYYNPSDPALLIEKRFGIGYTLNLGHPGAWLLMAFFLLVLPAVAVWLATAH